MLVKEFFEGPYIDMFETADRIMRDKMADYSGDGTFSGNFHRRAKEAGITPLQAWLVLGGKQWDAITTYVRNGSLSSETIDNRIADMINYMHLLNGLVKENIDGERDRGAPTETDRGESSEHLEIGGSSVSVHRGRLAPCAGDSGDFEGSS